VTTSGNSIHLFFRSASFRCFLSAHFLLRTIDPFLSIVPGSPLRYPFGSCGPIAVFSPTCSCFLSNNFSNPSRLLPRQNPPPRSPLTLRQHPFHRKVQTPNPTAERLAPSRRFLTTSAQIFHTSYPLSLDKFICWPPTAPVSLLPLF